MINNNNQGSILLTFDVEEFDLPIEYGIAISPEEQMTVGKEGIDVLKKEILDLPNINCTLFTTANFASAFPTIIQSLSEKHEIASHTYFHSTFKTEDLKSSKEILENITSNKVTGLRMPRMKQIETFKVKNAGYLYDSSINPTWLPGRYNNLKTRRTFFKDDGIIKVPVSVSPNFRVPLFWLAFKNFPYFYFKSLALKTLRNDGYLLLYFHPWEFAELKKYDLPAITKRKSGNELVNRLLRLIHDLKKDGDFITITSFLMK